MQLHNARSSNGFGPNPISFPEIDAFTRLTGTLLSMQEIALLTQADAAYRNEYVEQSKTTGVRRGKTDDD